MWIKLLFLIACLRSDSFVKAAFPKEDCSWGESWCFGAQCKNGEKWCVDEGKNCTRLYDAKCATRWLSRGNTSQSHSFWSKPSAPLRDVTITIQEFGWIINLSKEGFIPDDWNYVSLNVDVTGIDNEVSRTTDYVIIVSSDSQKIKIENSVKNSQPIHNFNLQWNFYGIWEFSRVDQRPKVSMTISSLEDHLSNVQGYTYHRTFLIIGILTLTVGSLTGGLGSLHYLKARKLRKEIAMERQRGKDEGDFKRPLSEGSYENPKVKTTPEYEEGLYEDDTYDATNPPICQNIEDKAKALNKSVIEVHFGM